jgi:cytochrome c biogenesis protein CcmG, thiol:disulfide interchange protein DsbE
VKQSTVALVTGIVVAILIVAAIAYYNFGSSHARIQTASQAPIVGKAQLGKPAPPFEVATTAGLFDLSKATKPVFLEVFATWCPHCQHVVGVINRVYAKYRDRVAFVAVSGSDTGMDGTTPSSELDVLDWIKRFHVAYPVAYDPVLNVANLYLQGGFPTVAIIARDKKISYLDDGEIGYGELTAALDKVLR